MKLPDAIIIGAQKCATTGLIYSLNYHPDIWCAHEMNYKKAKMPSPGNGGSELSFFVTTGTKESNGTLIGLHPGKILSVLKKAPITLCALRHQKELKLLYQIVN